MRTVATLAFAGAMLIGWVGAAGAQTATPVQYQPPGYGPPGYGQPGYGPPPGYPPPGYRPRDDDEDRPEFRRGFRCDAELFTPRGPRQLICPLDEPRPVGRRCECPAPPPPPGLPYLEPARGRVIR